MIYSIANDEISPWGFASAQQKLYVIMSKLYCSKRQKALVQFINLN